MAYRLKAGESVAENVRRIVGEEVDSATALLDKNHSKSRDEAVHEARKSIKKIRGLLRLVRPELGRAFGEENKRFRDIGRQLSQIRDATALLEIFEDVLRERKQALDGNRFAALRRGLKREKQKTDEQLDIEKVIQRASGTLHSAARRLKTWPLHDGGFGAIESGLKQTYRDGRKALAKAEKTKDPLDFHDFRKRVKDHWYHVRLLESLWTGVMQAHEASLKELETWLGNDHNLVMLREKVEAEPEEFGSPEEVKVFLAVAGQYQEELRANSLSLGHRIYAEKPKVFAREINRLWDAWQHQPEGMKQIEKSQRDPSAKRPASSAGKVKASAA
jgi:CHAD domain-containing protein